MPRKSKVSKKQSQNNRKRNQRERDGKSSRTWCFTWNNYDEIPRFDASWMRYLVYGYEQGAMGTPHLQGYIQTHEPKALRHMKEFIYEAHWEIARGNVTSNQRYCKKDGYYSEDGRPVTTGQRADLEGLVRDVSRGMSDHQLIHSENIVAYSRYPKLVQTVRSNMRPIRKEKLEVILLVGATGLGKSRWARDKYPDIYNVPISDRFWLTDDAYLAKEILLEDFEGEMNLKHLLQLLDRYPIRCQTKGSFTWWMPNIIIITCNDAPHTWYDYLFDSKGRPKDRTRSKDALFRRFTQVKEFIREEDGSTLIRDTNCKDLENGDYKPPQETYHCTGNDNAYIDLTQ